MNEFYLKYQDKDCAVSKYFYLSNLKINEVQDIIQQLEDNDILDFEYVCEI